MPTPENTKIWRAQHASRDPLFVPRLIHALSPSFPRCANGTSKRAITCVSARKVLVETPEGLPRSERPQRRQILPVLDVNTSRELIY